MGQDLLGLCLSEVEVLLNLSLQGLVAEQVEQTQEVVWLLDLFPEQKSHFLLHSGAIHQDLLVMLFYQIPFRGLEQLLELSYFFISEKGPVNFELHFPCL